MYVCKTSNERSIATNGSDGKVMLVKAVQSRPFGDSVMTQIDGDMRN